MRAQTSRLTVAALAAGMALAMTACTSATAPDASSSAGTASSAPAAAIDNALAAKYAGGTPGKAADKSLAPVYVGTINMEGGTVADPEAAVAMKAAFDYVNDQLGGIGGHPVELIACGAANTDEDVQKCAQQMLNDDKVSVVVEGGLNFGTQVLHAVLGKAKPVIQAQSNPGPDGVATNSFSFNANAIGGPGAVVAYAKYLNAKKVSIIGGDGAGDQGIATAMKGSLEAAGVEVNYTTFPATASDILTPLTAAGVASADMVMPAVVQPAQCVAASKGLQQLGVASSKVIGISLCASNAVKQLLGTWPQWTYASSTLSLEAPDPTGQVALYKAIMAKYAPADAELGINAPLSFGAALGTVNVLNTVGADKVTPEAVSGALSKFTGPILMGPTTLKFGMVPALPAIGSFESFFYRYDGTAWTEVEVG